MLAPVMRAAALLALCACDRVYGIGTTQEYRDAPIDAPIVCPALGTPPTFRFDLYQVPARSCAHYSVSRTAKLGLALCTPDPASTFIAEGPMDDALAMSSVDTADYPVRVQLAPEGDLMYDLAITSSLDSFPIHRLRRDGTAWTYLDDLPLGTYIPSSLSPPSFGPDRRILVTAASGGNTVVLELADDGTGWTTHDSYTASDFGTFDIRELTMTADGLRIVFVSVDSFDHRQVFYSDRDSLASRFRPAVNFPTVPSPDSIATPFMTEDCGRLYFSALDTVFFIEQ